MTAALTSTIVAGFLRLICGDAVITTVRGGQADHHDPYCRQPDHSLTTGIGVSPSHNSSPHDDTILPRVTITKVRSRRQHRSSTKSCRPVVWASNPRKSLRINRIRPLETHTTDALRRAAVGFDRVVKFACRRPQLRKSDIPPIGVRTIAPAA